MPQVTDGTTTITYEEFGSGYPMLLIAPGGLNSSIAWWERASINPLASYADDFRLIALDQRNAGSSTGPLPVTRPWDAYLADQLRVADHLGLETFHLFGCCIGGPFCLKFAAEAPGRISAMVLEQPMGIVPENREGWVSRCHVWVDELVARRSDLTAAQGAGFVEAMWRHDFAVSVGRREIEAIEVPTCVLPGIDEIHPPAVGREISRLISGSLLVEPWKDTPEHTEAAALAVREFLLAHTPDRSVD
jgi:pimeloyl-ACP methyl ester carboxylesterase